MVDVGLTAITAVRSALLVEATWLLAPAPMLIIVDERSAHRSRHVVKSGGVHALEVHALDRCDGPEGRRRLYLGVPLFCTRYKT